MTLGDAAPGDMLRTINSPRGAQAQLSLGYYKVQQIRAGANGRITVLLKVKGIFGAEEDRIEHGKPSHPVLIYRPGTCENFCCENHHRFQGLPEDDRAVVCREHWAALDAIKL